MPFTSDEKLAYQLLTTLTPQDLVAPLDAIPRVLEISCKSGASN